MMVLIQPETKLYAQRQFVANDRNVRLLLAQYGLKPERIQTAQSGIENQTVMVMCAGHDYVLRVYRQRKKTTSEINQEIDFMDYLRAHGLPVPRVITNLSGAAVTEVTIKGTIWQCIIMNRMAGEHPHELTPALILDMARLQARMHVLGIRYATQSLMRNRHLQGAITSAGHRSLSDLWNASRIIISYGLTKGVSHFDFTSRNILVEHDNITAILDFDDMNYAPVADCLAATITRLPQLAQNRSNLLAYLQAYQAIRPLSKAEKRRIKSLMFLKYRQLDTFTHGF